MSNVYSRPDTTQKVIGDADQVLVVANPGLWKSPLKDSLLYYFEAAYLLLPQPEPVFQVKHFTWEELQSKPIRKRYRTILMVADLSEPDAPETRTVKKILGEKKLGELVASGGFVVSRDLWGRGQLVFFVVGQTPEDLTSNLTRNFPAIAAKIRKHDEPLHHVRAFYKGKNQATMAIVRDSFGIEMDIPAEYITSAVRNREIVWIRRETAKSSSSLIFGHIPYRNEAQLSPDSLIAYVDSIGRKYIASEIQGSYFRINKEDLPLFKNEVNLHGHFAYELRGIWELENDYMGGPFVAYLMQNPSRKDELLLILGFVYAPEKDKKPYMEELETIIRTLK